MIIMLWEKLVFVILFRELLFGGECVLSAGEHNMDEGLNRYTKELCIHDGNGSPRHV